MSTIIYENNRQINPKNSNLLPFYYSGETSHLPFLLDGVGIIDCTGEYHLKRMQENDYIFIYILEGKMDLLYDGEHFLLHKNDMVLLDFRKYHEFYSSAQKNFLYFFVNILTSECITALYKNLYEKSFSPVVCSAPEELNAIIEKLFDVAKKNMPANYMTSSSLVSMLLAQFSKDLYEQGSLFKSKYRPKWCSEILAYISENYYQKVNFQSFAQKYSMSPQQFSISFKKTVGITPLEYLTETRLYHAKTLLQHTDKNLEIIAYETGFSSTSRFIKAFQEQNGVTPARFRISQRKNAKRKQKNAP